jgi:hypothetical protein
VLKKNKNSSMKAAQILYAKDGRKKTRPRKPKKKEKK